MSAEGVRAIHAGSEADASMHLDAALDGHERPPERAQQVDFSRELPGLYWLDSIIVALSLGSMSIIFGGGGVSAAAVATAFLLAPRYVGAGRPAETVAYLGGANCTETSCTLCTLRAPVSLTCASCHRNQ